MHLDKFEGKPCDIWSFGVTVYAYFYKEIKAWSFYKKKCSRFIVKITTGHRFCVNFKNKGGCDDRCSMLVLIFYYIFLYFNY